MKQNSLVKEIIQRAGTCPNSIAFAFLKNWETFEELVSNSLLDKIGRSIGGFLQSFGKQGEPVALFFPPGQAYIEALIGIIYAGMVPVPLYPPRPNQRRPGFARFIEISGTRLALCHPGHRKRILSTLECMGPKLRPRLISLQDVPPDAHERWVFPEEDPESLALLQFTSGATGEPKGIMVSHRNLWENQKAIARAFGTTRKDLCLSWLPPYHDMGLIGTILHPLFRGFSSFLISPSAFVRDPIGWLEAITRFGATLSGGPNFAYELCCRSFSDERRQRLDLRRWRVAFNGAEPVRAATLQRFSKAFETVGFRRRSFFPCYGMAEATLFISGKNHASTPGIRHFSKKSLQQGRALPSNSEESQDSLALVSCGRAQPPHRIAVVDPRTRIPCSPGQVGEIWFAGPSVAQGYRARPELTASQFKARLADREESTFFLRTGDLGFLFEEELLVTGRLKELIIIRGRNYHPQDIEATAMESHSAVKAAAAFSLKRAGESHLAIAVELGRGDAASAADEIIEAVRRSVAEEFALKTQTVLLLPPKGLLRTTSGKVRRRAMAKNYAAGHLRTMVCSVLEPARAAGAAPFLDRELLMAKDPTALREAVMANLCELAARSLRVAPEAIQPQGSLLSLGLDSLSAMELQQGLATSFGVSFSMAELLESGGLAAIATRVLARRETRPPVKDLEEAPPMGRMALSYNQMALWFLHRLAPGDASYHLSFALRLDGETNFTALQRSLEILVARHASLRTLFVAENGVPTRQVTEVPRELLVIETAEPPRPIAKEALSREACRPFDLAKDVPLRVRLLRDAEAHWSLQWTIHHIAVDHWSLAIVLKEFAALYRALAAQIPLSLPDPRVTYDEFVKEQARRLASAEGERDWEYWRSVMTNPPPPLTWPARLRRTRDGENATAYRFELSPELTLGLKRRTREMEVTLFTGLISIFQTLLMRLTGAEDFLIGTPATGRSNPDYRDLVGFLVNTLVLRAELSGSPTFRDVCERNQRGLLGAFDHQDFPFGLLVERLRPDRQQTRNPLFQVMFVLLQGEEEARVLALGKDGQPVNLGGLEATLVGFDRGASQFDVTLTMAEAGQGLAAIFEYDRALLDSEMIREMSVRFGTLAAAVVARPDRPVNRLPLLSPAEEERMLHLWAVPGNDPDQATIWCRDFEGRAVAGPDKVAVVFGERTWTYRYLNQRAAAWAHALRAGGLHPEAPVGIFMDRSGEMLAALVAIHKAGGAYLPLEPSYPSAYLKQALEDSGAALVFTERARVSSLPETGARPFLPEHVPFSNLRSPEPSLTASGLSHLIYTSGSTGRPKGVAITHSGVAALVGWAGSQFSQSELAGVLASTPLSFDLSVFEICVGLALGATVIVAENALALGEIPARERVSLLNTVPSAMAELLRREMVPSSVRSVNLAGEPLRLALVDRIYALPHVVRVRNLYGPSETTTYSCQAVMERDSREEPTIGQPLSGESAYVLDGYLNPLPQAFTGELAIGGEGLARGYYRRPLMTALRFTPHPFSREPGSRLYRTGDLARFLPDGAIDFLGRFDHQIKLRGIRIELGEIESLLNAYAGVTEAVVVVDGNNEGAELTAFTLSQGPPPSSQALREYLACKLPRHMVPNRFGNLERFPRLPNGKVDRNALRLIRKPEPEAKPDPRPMTAVEAVLAPMWASLLKREKVTPGDHFFELGGHSLLAARLVSGMGRAFAVDLEIRDIFEAPVLADLAVRIGEKLGSGYPQPSIPVSTGPGPWPLSFAQARLWFLEKLGCPQQVYHLAGAFRMKGPLHADALERSVAQAIERHEALRTYMFERDGEARQGISPTSAGHMPLTLVSDAMPGAANRFLNRAAATTFDLHRGPLILICSLRLEQEDHLLRIQIHHLVCDGWSLSVLANELAAGYRAFLQRRTPALTPLPLRYVDFALWQRQRHDRGDFQDQLRYWKTRLAGLPPLLDLPSDRPRPPRQIYRGATFPFSLDRTVSEQLKRLSGRENASIFMVLLAVFQVLLARYSARFDFAVGTPVANRNHGDLEGLVGFFANTLALRSAFSAATRFRELLQTVRVTVLEAYAQQDLPFEKLVEDLQPRRDLSFSPIFQVMFLLEENHAGLFQLPGLETRRSDLPTGHAKYDLTLAMREEGEGWSGLLEYSTDLFDAATVKRLAVYFKNLTVSATTDPERAAIHLDMLSDQEKIYFLLKATRSSKELLPNGLIHRGFEDRTRQWPETLALVCGSGQRTYSALNRIADRLAGHLRRVGIGPESLVGIFTSRGPEMVFAMLAVLKAGGAYVPLDPAYPEARLHFITADAGIDWILTETRYRSRLEKTAVRTLCLDRGWEDGRQPRTMQQGPAPLPQQLAYLIYTSGSTGRPKGVAIGHANTTAMLAWAARYFQPQQPDGTLASTSICFDLSVFELFLPLTSGGSVIMADQLLAMTELACRDRINLINTVPSAMAALLAVDGLPASTKTVNLAGEPLSLALVRRILEAKPGVRVFNLYGPSEDTTYSTAKDVTDTEEEPSIGMAIDGTHALVLDEALGIKPVGAAGELFLGGAGVSRGYFGRPALTAEKYVPDPFDSRAGARLYTTGDGARLLANGSLRFLGRRDHQVKIRGFRIEPGEIERAILTRGDVKHAVVAALKKPSGELFLTAYLVPRSNGTYASPERMRDFLAEILPHYMIPAHFTVLAALPRLPNGKIDRAALPYPESRDGAPFSPPRTPTEKIIASVWCRILERDRVGVGDSFFACGGHSLAAIRMVAALRSWFPAITLESVFERPTIAELARALEQTTVDGGEAPLEPVTRLPTMPASFAQERLWLLEQLETTGPAYHIGAGLYLDGLLDVPAAERSLSDTIERHEALRTAFVAPEGVPLQQIGNAKALSLPLTDLTAIDQARQEGLATDLAAYMMRRRFNLARGPLYRFHLLKRKPDLAAMFIVLHHLIADAWSLRTLLREWADRYRCALSGQAASLPALPLQYADYACWQREQWRHWASSASLTFWKAELEGAPALLDFPADRHEPSPSFRAGRCQLSLEAALVDRLQAHARTRDGTLFMVLLAAFQSVLAHWSNQSDIAVGVPFANRDKEPLACLAGLLVNTLVLRTYPAPEKRFGTFFREVRDTALAAYDRGDFPFELLVEALNPVRDLNRAPLFQAMFVLQDPPLAGIDPVGLGLDCFELDPGQAKFDLTLSLTETGNGLAGYLEYRRDLFTDTRIRRFAAQYRRALQGLTLDFDRILRRLSLHSPAERQLLLWEWQGANGHPFPPTALHEMFEETRLRIPDATAVCTGESWLSYGCLDEEVERLALRLRALACKSGDRMAICLERNAWMLAAMLAVLKQGAVYVPLDPDYPRARLEYLMEDSGAKWVLTTEATAKRLVFAPTQVVLADPDPGPNSQTPKHPEYWSRAQPQGTAYLIYTSGSTGRPKGVMIAHTHAAAMLRWALRFFMTRDLAGSLASTSICFDLSVFELFLPLSSGGTVIVSENALALGGLPCRHAVTLINTVPSAMEALLRQNRLPHRLRVVNLAGEALAQSLTDRIYRQTRVRAVFNLYGPSEAATYSTHARIEPENPEIPPIGRAIDGTQAYLLDRALALRPMGTIGELYLGGAGIAQGYFRKPARTAVSFIPDPWGGRTGARLYRTGDLARFSGDGKLLFLGRNDFQLKLRGYRIELGEIEAAIHRLEGIREAVVVAREKAGETVLAAYLVAEEGAELQPGSVRKALETSLPHYMVPGLFVRLDALPRTSNGKIDRAGLPDPVVSMPRESETQEARTPVERKLALIWCEVLKLDSVGIRQNFFVLGGHSLMAARVIARIRDQMALEIPVQSMFEAPTIEGLAARLAALHPASPAKPEPLPEPRPYDLPLSFGQERLWFLNQLEGASAAYHIPAALSLQGPLCSSTLERSIRRVIARHEVLRTRFPKQARGAFQRVSEMMRFSLPMGDLSGLDSETRTQAASTLIHGAANLSFSLDRSPLFRMYLLGLAQDSVILSMTMHHIISDGWSVGILIREIGEGYRAMLRGEPGELQAPVLQYADYASWQRQWFDSGAFEEQLGYWRKRLAQAPPLLEIPTDRPRPSIQRFKGKLKSFRIPYGLTEKLRAFCSHQRITPFMALLAIYQVLLARYSGQETVCVGTAVANRPWRELEGLIGFFFNTLVLRSDLPLSRNLKTGTFLEQVKQSTLTAFANQDVPFERVVEALQPERNLSYSPLFQVMLLFQNMPQDAPRLPGLRNALIDLDIGVAKFEMTLSLYDRADALEGHIEFNTDLFDETTIARMGRHFLELLRQIVADGNTSVHDLRLLDASERQRMLSEWNHTHVDYRWDRSIDELFERSAHRVPDAVALVSGEHAVAYAPLAGIIDGLARLLRSRGIGPGQRVGLCAGRSIEMVVAMLAVLQTGAAYVPLDPAYPPERLKRILDDAQPELLLTYTPTGTAFDKEWPSLDLGCCNRLASATAPRTGGPGANARDLAYLIYTSGSTGRPKGVRITHRNVVNLFAGMDRLMENRERGQPGVWLAVTSISFDISVLELLWTLTRGYLVVIGGERIPAGPGNRTVAARAARSPARDSGGLSMSLMYFAADEEGQKDKYRLLLEGARFADAQGFHAVWVPERHFHSFGGAFPNPSVAASAVAAITRRVRIRAGSVVLPLHHPIRVAEEWSMVDNLSGGRVDLSIASGWHPHDFALAPGRFSDRYTAMWEGIETLRALWRGEELEWSSGEGKSVPLGIRPRPIQPELNLWITAAGNPRTFESAGRIGANVLTHFLGQNIRDLEEKIQIYRHARQSAGHDPRAGRVTLMLHSFIGPSIEEVRDIVRQPFKAYLATAFNLIQPLAEHLDLDPVKERELILDAAFRRYFGTSALFGTETSCLPLIRDLRAVGVDEIACLIDFGVDEDEVLAGLARLKALYDRVNPTAGAAFAEPRPAVEEPPARLSPERLMKRHRVTHLQGTPSFVSLLAGTTEGRESLSRLKLLLVGGEKLPSGLAHRLISLLPERVVNMYGPTETTVWSSCQRVDPTAPGSIGRPIANTRAYVLSFGLRSVPTAVTGELFLGGDGLAQGYQGMPGVTATRFLPDPFAEIAGSRLYRTGDLARYLPDGRLEFQGRKDDQVKIRGFRVELGEIETLLDAHPAVDKAVARVEEHGAEDRRLAAYLRLKPDSGEADVVKRQLRDYLKNLLPDFMVPGPFFFVDSFPLMPNGKIDRRKLSGLTVPAQQGTGTEPAFSAPKTETEARLVVLWKELLKLERVGTDDNFFELGGHSMLVPGLHRRIHEELGREIGIADIFKYARLSEMAAYLDSLGTAAQPVAEAADSLEERRQTRAQKQLQALRERRLAKIRVGT